MTPSATRSMVVSLAASLDRDWLSITERELAALPHLGPASARWLVGAGIGTVAELRRIGPVAAFNRVSIREGRAATANLLYALYAALPRSLAWVLRFWRHVP